jgi:subtilisin family serine protease
MPSATPQELASAIVETISAGAKILNVSAALVQPSARGEGELQSALDYAAQRAVIIVAATGNQGVVGSSVITRHPWLIPVAGCDLQGRPLSQSNLGNSIGKRSQTLANSETSHRKQRKSIRKNQQVKLNASLVAFACPVLSRKRK